MVFALRLARRREMVSRPPEKHALQQQQNLQHRSRGQETGDDSEVHSPKHRKRDDIDWETGLADRPTIGLDHTCQNLREEV